MFSAGKIYAVLQNRPMGYVYKTGTKHASKDEIELAFAQQTGISTRGTRFDFRLAVLVLVLAVRNPGFCLRYKLPIPRHRTPGFFSSLFANSRRLLRVTNQTNKAYININ